MSNASMVALLAALVGGIAEAKASSEDGMRLDGAGIRSKVIGKRVYLRTPLGGEFPLYYRADGRVDASGEAAGLGRWVRPSDSGRWWIDGSRLCQKWQTWYEGKPFCFTVEWLGRNQLRWTRDDGLTGVSRLGG